MFGVLPSDEGELTRSVSAASGHSAAARSRAGTPSTSDPPALESREAGESEELRRLRATDGAHRMLALAQAMRSICALTQAPDGSGPIQIRIGLHVGPAVAAVVGTQMLRCARVRSGALAYRVCLDVSIWGVYIWRGCRSPLPASRSIPARPCWSNH